MTHLDEAHEYDKTIDEYERWLSRAHGEPADRTFKAYPANDDSEAGKAYYRLTVDNNFAGHRTWARLHAQNSGSPVYLYLFSHHVPAYSPTGQAQLT